MFLYNWANGVFPDGTEAQDSRPWRGVTSEHIDAIRHWVEAHQLLCPIDVLLVGATGAGKSSTLNALFGETRAQVGNGVAPETQQVSAHQLHKLLRFHDSAGLGDEPAADRRHAENITARLQQRATVQGKEYLLIDLVLVLLDGGSRDLGTTYQLLEKVILQGIEPERVVIAINQADMAMKGRYWNEETARPEPELFAFLNEKAESVQRRIKDTTGLTVSRPVCYSALHGYNMNRLVEQIIRHLPLQRRQGWRWGYYGR